MEAEAGMNPAQQRARCDRLRTTDYTAAAVARPRRVEAAGILVVLLLSCADRGVALRGVHGGNPCDDESKLMVS